MRPMRFRVVAMTVPIKSSLSEVMIEAHRFARQKIKEAIKKAGLRKSFIPAKEITEASRELIAGALQDWMKNNK